jgi:hypothetical protein
MFSNPYVYQVVDYLFSVPVVEHIFTLSDSILRASAMTQGGIEGVNDNPALGFDKFVAKVICGTLGGCGGGIWIGKDKTNMVYVRVLKTSLIRCFPLKPTYLEFLNTKTLTCCLC